MQKRSRKFEITEGVRPCFSLSYLKIKREKLRLIVSYIQKSTKADDIVKMVRSKDELRVVIKIREKTAKEEGIYNISSYIFGWEEQMIKNRDVWKGQY